MELLLILGGIAVLALAGLARSRRGNSRPAGVGKAVTPDLETDLLYGDRPVSPDPAEPKAPGPELPRELDSDVLLGGAGTIPQAAEPPPLHPNNRDNDTDLIFGGRG